MRDHEAVPPTPMWSGGPAEGVTAVGEQRGSIRVVLVDDHVMFTQSLAGLLSRDDEIEIVGIAATGADGVRLVSTTVPDVVVLDQHLPDDGTPDLAGTILRLCPSARVVMLSSSGDDRSLLAALDAGCLGFLTTDRAVEELVDAVRQVHAGEAYVPASMIGALLPHLGRPFDRLGADLTEREREVLACLGDGMSNAGIAERLFLSVHTVRSHVQSILTKLGAHSKLEAASIASREGLLGTAK